MRVLCWTLGIWAFILAQALAQNVFVVQEGAPVGTFIGQINSPGPYLIVPLDASGDSQESNNNPEDDFIINSNNGEIRTRKLLDRERKEKYLFSAIPLNGESIQVSYVKKQTTNWKNKGDLISENVFQFDPIFKTSINKVEDGDFVPFFLMMRPN